MKMKAQAAMEYLMTYGWAILIVIIVAAALYMLGVFNPATYTGTTATGFGTIGTPKSFTYNTTGLFVEMQNKVGRDVNITSITSDSCTGAITPTPLAPGGDAVIALQGCTGKTAGDTYSEAVIVKYTVGGAALESVDSGTLTGTVV